MSEQASASSNVKSAERTLSVLRFLAGRVRPVPSMVIARELGLPKSSTYHLLNVMKESNFVTYYPDAHAWALGPSAFEIGTSYLRAEPLAWLGRPVLRKLAAACRVTAHLAVLYGQDVLYLVKESPPEGNSHLVSRVGVRLPAHLTAVGRAIMMRLPPAQLQAIYPPTNVLVRRTHRGPALLSELERELKEARERGYAVDEGMTTPGVTCMAASVFAHDGRAVAGLGITFATDQLGLPLRSELAAHTSHCATQLSLTLGWRSDEHVVPDGVDESSADGEDFSSSDGKDLASLSSTV
jgi:DNA-binding IclR family transcriptional regulator